MKAHNGIIHVDLDGVLVDLIPCIVNLIGGAFEDLGSDETWNRLRDHPRLFSLPDPMVDAKRLVEGVAEIAWWYDYEVRILTALPWKIQMEHAERDKHEWFVQNFPDHQHWPFHAVSHAEHKQHFAKPTCVLIDDMIRNIDQWRSQGGYGIHHTKAEESLIQLAGFMLTR